METKKQEIVKLLNDIHFIEKAFDVMRIIDPVKHKVLSYSQKQMLETPLSCYDFWAKGKFCDNCISLKAYKENDTFIKFEYYKEKVYMILAVPAVMNEWTVVVELLKDVTSNLLTVSKEEGETEVDVHSIIKNTSNLLFKDHLTGIYNRRYIDERLQVDIINNSIQKRTLSLIMADIDFFKKVNDTYGHVAGDYILKEVAAIMASCIRSDKDWIGRYGGEEFLICLPDTAKEDAINIAERMRTKIEESVFEYEGQKFNVTTSFGVYSLVATENSSMETIVNSVDKNLYAAKQSGRNRVVFS